MLEKSNIALQGVINAVQDMLRILDSSGNNVLYQNEQFKDYFGASSQKCYEVFGETARCKDCLAKKVLATGRFHEKTLRYRDRTLCVQATPVHIGGEITCVMETFRDITQQQRKQWQLYEQNKRLISEASFAARMQRDLFLAQGTPDDAIALCSRYLPASTLGGDMFGCLQQDDGKIIFYVADVSGHGIEAAMITLVLANVLRGMKADSPVSILQHVREAFLAMVKDDRFYVSMFVALLNPQTGEFKWANAGLNAVPLLRGEDGLEHLYLPGLPICDWQDDIIYRERVNYLPPNGQILLYTDGLLDEKSSRLTEAGLEEYFMNFRGDALLDRLEQQVLPYHDDDICVLLVARNPNVNNS